MRTFNYLFAVCLLILSIFTLDGCKKDDDDGDNPGENTSKIKVHHYDDNSIYGVGEVTENYDYDAQGRVSTVTYTGGIDGVDLYTYYTDSIRLLTHHGDQVTYLLNNQGYVISGPNSSTFSYDASWHLITEDFGDVEFTSHWSGDNLTEQVITLHIPSTFSDTTTFTYWTDKTNTVGNSNKGMTFLGKDSKNPVKTKTLGNGDTEAFSYEYDAQNRIIKVNGDETYTYY